MTELAWNMWTIEKEPEEGAGKAPDTVAPNSSRRPDSADAMTHPAQSPDADSSNTTPPATEETKVYVRRPWYQRVPFAGAQIAVGIGIAVMVLTSHARVVQRIRVVPASTLVQNEAYRRLAPALQPVTRAGKGKKQAASSTRAVPDEQFIFLEAASNRRGHGNVFPLKSCMLERGVNDEELGLIVEGLRGKFWLGLPDAAV